MMLNWIEYAVVREAHRVRTEQGYSPEGSATVVAWADRIEESERKGIQRRRPSPTRTVVRQSTPEEIREKQLARAGIRLRDAIRSARNNGLIDEATKLQEFYDANYR